MADFEVSFRDDLGNRDFTVTLRDQFDRHEAMRKGADVVAKHHDVTAIQLRCNGCREIERQAIAPYLREFPDYKPADMPALPDGFEDASWHNDACPSFVSDPVGLLIWIDFANPAEREFPEGQRFNVVQQRAGIEVSGPFLQTDDWSEVLAFIELQRQRVTYDGGVYYVAG